MKRYNSSQVGGDANAANMPQMRSKLITNSLKALYSEMDQMAKASGADIESLPNVTPFIFVHVLRQAFPQFNTQDERGNHQQQDANECFTELLRMISDELAYTPEKPEGFSFAKLWCKCQMNHARGF